jgi:hypothetical protein
MHQAQIQSGTNLDTRHDQRSQPHNTRSPMKLVKGSAGGDNRARGRASAAWAASAGRSATRGRGHSGHGHGRPVAVPVIAVGLAAHGLGRAGSQRGAVAVVFFMAAGAGSSSNDGNRAGGYGRLVRWARSFAVPDPRRTRLAYRS